MLRDQETSDVVTALAIGAVVGVGVALLMRGDDISRREKLLREIRPLARRATRRAHRARTQVERGARHTRERIEDSARYARDGIDDGARYARDRVQDGASSAFDQVGRTARAGRARFEHGTEATLDAADSLRRVGSEVVSDLRDEIASLLSSAGAELRRTARRTVRDTRRSLRNLG